MSSDGFGPLLSMCVVEFPVGMTQCLDFRVCYGLLLRVSAGIKMSNDHNSTPAHQKIQSLHARSPINVLLSDGSTLGSSSKSISDLWHSHGGVL